MSAQKPSKRQLEWADMEIGVIIHYLIEIYNPDFEGYKTAAVRTELPPDIFNPSGLDPEQWVRSAYEAGAKYAVLVVNHCSGFSLWQTKVNDYSCASIKWKNGRGDIFREFVDACKKYGIKPGVYYSTGCNGYYDINDEEEQDYNSPKYRDYVKCVERQVEEIWSEYGEMFEIWFDGGIIPKERGGPDIYPLLKKYQPDALTFQGPVEAPHNLRWVGNEDGFAPENCRATCTAETRGITPGDPDGDLWIPAETDFPNRSHKAHGGGWGWREGEEKYALTPEELLDRYIKSVGRNTNMLLGMGIGANGCFQDEKQFADFGKLLKKTFGTPILTGTASPDGTTVFKNENGAALNYLVVCEDITDGEKVLGFTVEADGKTLYEGECVGHKRIVPLGGISPVEIKFTVTALRDSVKIKSAEIF